MTTAQSVIHQRLGEMLLAKDLISSFDIDQTLSAQALSPYDRFGTLLIRRGIISEEALLPILAEQLKIPLLGHAEIITHKDVFDRLRETRDLPLNWCKHSQLVFWEENEKPCILIAVARDPLKSIIRETLSEKFPEKTISWHLSGGRDFDRFFDEMDTDNRRIPVGNLSLLKELAEEAPIIELVNNIFARATDARASDIHIEPEEFGFSVRVRVDGVIHTLETFAREKFDATISRIKLISELDIAERRLPQDGRISIRAGGKESDVRVSVIPGVWGESVVMRLLPKERGADFSLDHLGMEEDHRKLFEEWIREPHGIVLVTGPTGSGKSTTLYTALSLANDRTNKIITVEDPVEFKLHGVTQIQVQSEIGFTFASALRSILRHDPDIVMIGEIRDLETAQIAVQASLTGHMVFSTLHTNDAISAFNRLIDMGVESFLVASSLRGIIAQRLVRRLCDRCSTPHAEAEIAPLLTQQLPKSLEQQHGPANWRKPTGCSYCNHTGYRGRVGIYEFLPVDAGMQSAISSNKVSLAALGEQTRKNYRSMRDDGLNKAYRGITTLEEVLRMTGSLVED